MAIDPIMSWQAAEHPAAGPRSYGEHAALEIAAHVAAQRRHRIRLGVAALAHRFGAHLRHPIRRPRIKRPARPVVHLSR